MVLKTSFASGQAAGADAGDLVAQVSSPRFSQVISLSAFRLHVTALLRTTQGSGTEWALQSGCF